jgi:hypothetical protein
MVDIEVNAKRAVIELGFSNNLFLVSKNCKDGFQIVELEASEFD